MTGYPRPPYEQDRLSRDPDSLLDVVWALYIKLTHEPQLRRNGILGIVNLLYSVSNTNFLREVLSLRELDNLRGLVLEICLDLLAEDTYAPQADPDTRYMLQQFYHAIQLLGKPEKGDPLKDQIQYGLLCMNLDRHREARDVFQDVLRLQPDNAFAQSALDYATDCMSFPRFRLGFVARCTNAWEYMSRNIAAYQKDTRDQETFDTISDKVFHIWTGLDIAIGFNTTGSDPLKTGFVEFPMADWQLSYYPIGVARNARREVFSKDLLRDWDTYYGTSPYHGKMLLRDGSVLTLDDIHTVLVDTPEHDGVHVKLYHPSLQEEPVSPPLLKYFRTVIASMLTAPAYCILIRSVELLSQKPGRFTGTVGSIPEQLEAMGYTQDFTMQDVETRMRVAYTRRPKKGPCLRLRDDILQGTTTCWQLQEEYERHETAAADYFTNRGIGPVFLAWPRSIMRCSEETFRKQLVDGLGTGKVSWNLQILGSASGREYCYLDLLMWSTLTVVNGLSAYLSRLPGGDSFRIQSFYYDAYPCPISQTYLFLHSLLPDMEEVFPGCSATRSASPLRQSGCAPSEPASAPKRTASQSKTKKKNAAKAKRKHNKKFR